MSICDVISIKVAAKELFAHPPSRLGFPMLRRLYLAPEVNDLVFAKTGDEDWKIRRVKLQLELECFVDGHDLKFALPNDSDPYEDKPEADLRLLYKWTDEVWELRSRMHPQIRIFGCFAAPDCFVALVWEFRCKLGTPPWQVTADCRTKWAKLFPNHSPHNGKTIHDYITSNAFPC
jgi:hypothetical protein